MKHKLILIYGPGSGFGKSTTGHRLTEELEVNGQQVEFWEEHHVSEIDAFQPYVSQVHAGVGEDVETLLSCCKNVASILQKDPSKLFILDSLLPCWDWLAAAGCAPDKISDFTHKLSDCLTPLNPLLVLIEGDMQVALNRAVQDRGEEWGLVLAEKRTGNRNLESLFNFFEGLRAVTNAELPNWAFDMVRINTVEASLDECIKSVMGKL